MKNESADTELESWKREWQELGGEEGLAKELATRVVKDGRRIKRSALIEVLATVFSTSLCVWLMARSHGELITIVVCASILIFNGVWITRLFTLREGRGGSKQKEDGNGLDAFVDLTRTRMTDDLRWNKFATRAMQVLTLMIIPWSIWAFVARYEMYRAEPWRAFVGFGVAFGILAGCFVVARTKRRKLLRERDRFEHLVAERTLV